MSRLERLVEDLRTRQIERFLISNISSVRYLSGFSGSTAAMGVGPGFTTLVTDFRYQEQAEGEVYRGIDIKIDKRDALMALIDLVSDFDGMVGFESASLTYASYEKIRDKLKANPVPVEGAVEALRQVKDDNEIASITRAAKIADAVFGEIVGELKAGMSEIDVAARIDFLLRKKSAEVPSFETIVASGERASLPHAKPTPRLIGDGDVVKMDFGAIWDGYCSDITRTVVVGKASDEIRKIYDIVLNAGRKAIGGIKAGAGCREVDSIARDYIEQAGYGDRFGHGLGHGVGLEVHEGPRLSQKSDEVLQAGVVVTVEPGIYIPGWGGVRIEDMVVVEDGGARILTSSPKDLMEVGL